MHSLSQSRDSLYPVGLNHFPTNLRAIEIFNYLSINHIDI